MQILIVDDSLPVQQALGDLLAAEHGLRVVGFAEDRAQAMALIGRLAPDLVVLDVELARHDRGYDVLKDIRAGQPGLPVVILSNDSWSAMRTVFFEAGASAYFDKALEVGQAIDWIRRRAARAADLHAQC